jgi:predicted 2-oxoglutarate/Fe(II)-dependent dioxygenase YbiX/peroxiredoxin
LPSFHIGDPTPWFKAATPSNPQFNFSLAAGRYVVLLFVRSSADEATAGAIAAARARPDVLNDDKACVFVVTPDPADRERTEDNVGLRWFLDEDGEIARLYNVLDDKGAVQPQWIALDPTLRTIGSGAGDSFPTVLEQLELAPPPERHAGIASPAPVLVIPRVFEPELCRELIGLYETNGGTESGFMREIDGKTVAVTDPSHKRRSDYVIEDEAIRQACAARIVRRVIPEIKKVFQFTVTRMERYIIGCYDAEAGGHFRAHRDNTTKGTAHRRFAVTLNLNAEQYEGGELRFPEFGRQTYKPPTGGVVVFSCSLMHEATPVTRGRRYAFLPFLYDEEAARIREANNPHLDESVGQYRSGSAEGKEVEAEAEAAKA